jgi:TolB protein
MRLFDVGLGKPMLAKRYSGPAKDARRMINQFTNAVLEAITGVPGVFGSQIIFTTGPAAKKNIMITELGSDEATSVAGNRGGPSTQPTLGPGGRMAWIHRNGSSWELLLDGKVVSSGPTHLSPAFKPDGTLVAAYSEPLKTSIYSFAGRGKTLLTGPGGINVSPTFSPDGARMAFVSDLDGSVGIYTSSANGGPPSKLPIPGKATDPAWSPTGEYIVFVSRETDICVIRPDGSGYRQLTGGQAQNYRPSFSPDGRLIVFSSTRNGREQLFVLSSNGDSQQLLLPELSANQDLPYWCPTMPPDYK